MLLNKTAARVSFLLVFTTAEYRRSLTKVNQVIWFISCNLPSSPFIRLEGSMAICCLAALILCFSPLPFSLNLPMSGAASWTGAARSWNRKHRVSEDKIKPLTLLIDFRLKIRPQTEENLITETTSYRKQYEYDFRIFIQFRSQSPRSSLLLASSIGHFRSVLFWTWYSKI